MKHIANCNSGCLELAAFLLPFTISKRTFWHILTTAKHLLLPFLFLLAHEAAFCQADSIQPKPAHDSENIRHDAAKNELFNYIKKFGDSDRRKKILEFTEDTIATKQDRIIKLVQKLSLGAKTYLDNGTDTAGLTAELTKIKRWYDIASDGVYTNTGNIQSHRNLDISYKIIRELLTRVAEKKSSLDEYNDSLAHLRNTIDSLYKEDILYRFSSDSAVLMRYVERLTVVLQEIKPVDTSL